VVEVYIGIGSNIEPTKNINQAMSMLKLAFADITFSRIFESVSVGFEGSNFLNLVAKFTTQQSINEVVYKLKSIENEMGRIRGSKKFCDRRIDIDVLLYGQQIFDKPVEVPRSEILENAYVLWPLSELAPELIHPGSAKNYRQLWQAFNKETQQLTPVG
jgi:2-amino-4-hydroxy-6-hydroxymethyldihydropteridine diphosphokinase